MKKLILLFHFSFFILHSSSAQQYGWTDISKSLPDYPFDTTIINQGADTIYAHISDISFISDNEGWVTTWHPFNDQSAALLYTTDGGGTWEVQTVMRPCQVIHMVDENVGYAGSDGGLIFKTTDGGQNWNFFGISGAPITGMSFPAGSDTGYICSYMSSNLQQITPEGVDPISLGNTGWWNSISAPSHNLIWLCSGSSVWTFDEDGLTDQPITSASYNSIDFVKNTLGWGVGNEGVKDRNLGIIAGCVGKNIPWLHLKYTEHPLYDVFALDEDHVWAAGFKGYIYYSENASQFDRDSLSGEWWSDVVFTPQSQPRPDLDLHKVYFSSLHNGYAAGGYNTLLRYTQIAGVQEVSEMEVKLWPNPTTGQFKVQSTKFKVELKSLELVDIYGNILPIPTCQLPTANCQLDLSHLPAGIYFIRISLENQTIVKKVIKL